MREERHLRLAPVQLLWFDAAMSVGVAVTEPVEAVIISGPRRGEIIRLGNGPQDTVSPDDLSALNRAIDGLSARLDGLCAEVRAVTRAFRPSPDAS